MSTYTDVHRAFLQVVLARGTLILPQAMDILRDIIVKHGNEKNARGLNRAMLLEHVEKINQKLAAVDQKLELVEMEIKIPNKEFIVFTNVTRTAAAALKYNGLYNEMECNYFKLVLDGILLSATYSLSSMHILNLSSHVTAATVHKKLTKQRAQELTDSWINAGYLLDFEDAIHLGPRTIGEFKDYIILKHRDHVPMCGLCMQPTFYGQPCPNTDCNIIIHHSCARKYFVKNKKCLLCKTVWEFDQ